MSGLTNFTLNMKEPDFSGSFFFGVVFRIMEEKFI